MMLLSVLASASAAGVQHPAPAALPPAQVTAVIDRAAKQVSACYRSPKVNRAARQIVTVLRVQYSKDGMLVSMPEVAAQDGVYAANQYFAPLMAQAAISAVIQCAPLKLPVEFHPGGWDAFDLIFSPRGLA